MVSLPVYFETGIVIGSYDIYHICIDIIMTGKFKTLRYYVSDMITTVSSIE